MSLSIEITTLDDHLVMHDENKNTAHSYSFLWRFAPPDPLSLTNIVFSRRFAPKILDFFLGASRHHVFPSESTFFMDPFSVQISDPCQPTDGRHRLFFCVTAPLLIF